MKVNNACGFVGNSLYTKPLDIRIRPCYNFIKRGWSQCFLSLAAKPVRCARFPHPTNGSGQAGLRFVRFSVLKGEYLCPKPENVIAVFFCLLSCLRC